MKLALTNIGRRKVKKIVGRHNLDRLSSMPMPKVGDVIGTCAGVNEVITGVFPEIHRCRGRQAIIDFRIVTARGGHSLLNCCDWPALTKAQIEENWAYWRSPEGCEKAATGYACIEWVQIAEAIEAGEQLFDERGMPLLRFNELLNIAEPVEAGELV